MSSYRQALKTARTEYIRKLIDNHQNNPRFLFSTVARLTNKQMSPDLNIPSQFNSNDFMNFFTDKIDNIRNTITNVDSTASSTSASFIAPKEKRSGYYGNLGSLRAGTRHHGDFSVMGTPSLQPFLKSYWLTPVK